MLLNSHSEGFKPEESLKNCINTRFFAESVLSRRKNVILNETEGFYCEILRLRLRMAKRCKNYYAPSFMYSKAKFLEIISISFLALFFR